MGFWQMRVRLNLYHGHHGFANMYLKERSRKLKEKGKGDLRQHEFQCSRYFSPNARAGHARSTLWEDDPDPIWSSKEVF